MASVIGQVSGVPPGVSGHLTPWAVLAVDMPWWGVGGVGLLGLALGAILAAMMRTELARMRYVYGIVLACVGFPVVGPVLEAMGVRVEMPGPPWMAYAVAGLGVLVLGLPPLRVPRPSTRTGNLDVAYVNRLTAMLATQVYQKARTVEEVADAYGIPFDHLDTLNLLVVRLQAEGRLK